MIRALTVAGALLALAGLAPADEGSFGSLTTAEVAAKLKQKGVFVYDNNPPEMFHAGHVPGAKWLDYRDVAAADLPADKEATLIFYCANEH
jgi:rhodanese-related sulfurtransferase